MLKMMIVDDEKIIRDSMRDSIDWNRIGIEIMGLCKNGLEAYDMILDESPDIVLTDIRMPALSGLELIQRITQTGQEIEFIILSGYGEFSYAKEAMRYGIKHYLLKPCNEAELVAVVQEAARACYQRKVNRPEYQRYFQEHIFRNLIVECFSEEYPDYSAIVEQYEWYINFTQVSYDMIVMDHVTKEQRDDTVLLLKHYHQSQTRAVPAYFLRIDDRVVMLFETYEYDYLRLDDLVKKLPAGGQTADCRSFANLLGMLHELRHQVLAAHRVELLQNDKWIRIHRQNSAYDTAEQIKARINAGPEPAALMAEIQAGLAKLSDTESLKTAITSIFMHISQHQANNYKALQTLEKLAEISAATDPDDIRQAAVGCLSAVLNERTAFRTGKDFIDKTITYVREHLSDPDLSLKKIAETELFMNVGYLSRQFQKYTGCKFSAFLAQTRIEEAKRIMATDPGATVQDVAVAVGCGNNPQYFSLLFKKHTGSKAIDYIKKMRDEH